MPLLSCCASFIGGILGALFGRELFTTLNKSYANASPKDAIEENKKQAQLYNLQGLSVLSESKVQGYLENIFHDRYGGMWVLGAPTGSGKSVYVGAAITATRRDPKFDAVIVLLSGSKYLNYDTILSELNGTEKGTLTLALPRYAIIVIDQVDIVTISQTQLEAVVQLATEGHNQRSFAILLIVSNPLVFNEILNSNGGQKITALCDPKRFLLSGEADSTVKYLCEMMSHYESDGITIDETQAKILLNMCGSYFSPEIGFDLRRETAHGKLSISELRRLAFDCAKQHEERWRKFINIVGHRNFRFKVDNLALSEPKSCYQ